MIVSIIAPTDTAKDWHKTPHDYSMGLNDAGRHGHGFNALGIFNHKSKFTPERQQIIQKTKPVKLYTNCISWDGIFDDIERIRLRSWDGILRRDFRQVACSDTSPIIAMNIAYILGASKIILWGVNFTSHWLWNPKNPNWNMEKRAYRGMYDLLLEKGVEVYHGTEGSALDFIPVWE